MQMFVFYCFDVFHLMFVVINKILYENKMWY